MRGSPYSVMADHESAQLHNTSVSYSAAHDLVLGDLCSVLKPAS